MYVSEGRGEGGQGHRAWGGCCMVLVAKPRENHRLQGTSSQNACRPSCASAGKQGNMDTHRHSQEAAPDSGGMGSGAAGAAGVAGAATGAAAAASAKPSAVAGTAAATTRDRKPRRAKACCSCCSSGSTAGGGTARLLPLPPTACSWPLLLDEQQIACRGLRPRRWAVPRTLPLTQLTLHSRHTPACALVILQLGRDHH